MAIDPSGRPADPATARVGESFHPNTWRRRQEMFGSLDPHFAQTWADHVERLLARPQLDRRKRLLVLTGQYTMRGDVDALEETIVAACDAGVDPREVLETIFQCHVYAGQGRVATAAEVFHGVVDRLGLLERVRADGRASDAAEVGRSLESERATWAPADRDDPRLERLIGDYGWYGISTGLRLRPGHHINLVATLDALDPGFLSIWLDTVYKNLYSRRVLDDATRLLCVVGNCFAVGESHQARRHMRGALQQGTSPRELLEVIFQSCVIVGHPHMLPLAVDDLIAIVDSEGRLGELVGADRIDEVRGIVERRLARREGIRDLGPGSTAVEPSADRA
jgi:alkylhydroperoxidase/carboxymuconolactone decarboxylase family protein YurZ